AVEHAHSLGVVLVAAAGNDNERLEQSYPGGLPDVIAAAASCADDTICGNFSNWGSKIDVAAPGVDILSLRAAGVSAMFPVGTQYQRLTGTSMASPHVSALAALVLSHQPQLTAEQVRQAIRLGADDLGDPGPDNSYGYG